jgi:chromate transport protein ChrA
MLELIVVALVVAATCKIASADNQSPIIWGSVTLLFCFGCFLIPMPFLRVGLAFILAFVAMIGYKTVANR